MLLLFFLSYLVILFEVLFGDRATAEAILRATTPAECKSLGRGVDNFDENLWMENRTRILSNGLYLKVLNLFFYFLVKLMKTYCYHYSSHKINN